MPTCSCDFRLFAVTFTQGAFPNGWLFGVDIPLNELATELNIGAPYTATPAAAFTLGPFFGLPHVTFYAVVVGVDNGQLLGGSNAISYTIP